MIDKRFLIIANWKMHLNTSQASRLLHSYQTNIHVARSIEVVIAPNMLVLQPLSLEVNRRRFRLASQDGYWVDEGAFMGEVSYAMQRDIVHYAVIGHSARRVYAGETNEMVRDKVAAAIRSGITPVICIGETKVERTAGETRKVIHDQLSVALSDLTDVDVSSIVIAYEPIWAISTFDGEIATPDTIKKELQFIRKQISELYGQKVADKIRLLYGGSVNEDDCVAYAELDECEGLLVGAASLNVHKFQQIVQKCA
jgi:triosephosphate isomerase (TIM)